MSGVTWVEISRDALAANFRAVAEQAGVPVCAVVKANGYGHGIEAARVFAEEGAAMLGVTRIEEARAIRDAGITTPVLIFMPVPDAAEATALGCEVTVGSLEDIALLPADARAHLKIDTGMGRLGVRAADAVEAAEAIASRAALAGIWTHLADAAGSSGRAQIDRFRAALSALRHHGIEARAHASNSAALLELPDARFDMVRVGTLLYGQDPPGATAPWSHAETFSWHARVVSVRTLPAGSTVGYGSEWTADRPARIGTLAVGYADGFTVEPHARSGAARDVGVAAKRALKRAVRRDGADRVVWFGERAAKVVGRVAMQATTVLLDGLDDVGVGSVARIPARRLMVSPEIERVVV